MGRYIKHVKIEYWGDSEMSAVSIVPVFVNNIPMTGNFILDILPLFVLILMGYVIWRG